jgi:hypothetical protein
VFSAAAGEIRVYPNPFSESARIVFPNPYGKEYRLVLTDLAGKICLAEDNITGSEYVLRRSGMAKGIYLLELRGPETYRCRIVIE